MVGKESEILISICKHNNNLKILRLTKFIDNRFPLRISGFNRFEVKGESEVDFLRTTILKKVTKISDYFIHNYLNLSWIFMDRYWRKLYLTKFSQDIKSRWVYLSILWPLLKGVIFFCGWSSREDWPEFKPKPPLAKLNLS